MTPLQQARAIQFIFDHCARGWQSPGWFSLVNAGREKSRLTWRPEGWNQ